MVELTELKWTIWGSRIFAQIRDAVDHGFYLMHVILEGEPVPMQVLSSAAMVFGFDRREGGLHILDATSAFEGCCW